MALHDAAIKDDFFIKRKLAPNVDFWYAQFPACSLRDAKLQTFQEVL
jgi:hypothetical protein